MFKLIDAETDAFGKLDEAIKLVVISMWSPC